MGMINLNDVQPGMTLAQDVKDRAGRVLLTAQTELTEGHIKIFRKWGVTAADIEGVSRDEIATNALQGFDPATVEEAKARAEKLFSHADTSHPVMNELLMLCTKRLMTSKPKEEPSAG
jgi:hypothetical protein